MDAERLEREARALVSEVRRSGALPLALATDTLERSVDAIESALAAPAPASAEAVARAVRQADLVPYNTPQEYDVACAQRAACEMAALNCIDAMRPGSADAQAWDAVAWEAARFMIAKVTDVCNKIDRDLKSCDGPASERRRLDTLARGAMAVWAALDESVVREAVSHALRAQRPGGAS